MQQDINSPEEKKYDALADGAGAFGDFIDHMRGFIDDEPPAQRPPEDAEPFSLRNAAMRTLYDLASVAVSAVVVVALVFLFGFRMVGVMQNSMVPTLEEGQSLIVTAFMPSIKPHDIVIITKPGESDPLVKRVIALGGQTIKIDFQSGQVWVDGILQYEPFINERMTVEGVQDFPIDPVTKTGEVVVPEDSVFVMGDNRNHSKDSRSSVVGFVRKEYLMGKVLFRVKPFGSWDVYGTTP